MTRSKGQHQSVGESPLLESTFRQVGEVEREAPHFEDADFQSSVNRVEVQVRHRQNELADRQFVAKRRVVVARDGASVLPYFRVNDRWKIVLVEQFRVAVGKATLEAPGGVVEDGENALITMARELAEEAGLEVQPDQIALRFKEFYLPPLLDGSAWGGIVEVDQAKHPGLDKSLLLHECENGVDAYSVRRVLFLDDVLELRKRSNLGLLDLWTSRLISEVADATGVN